MGREKPAREDAPFMTPFEHELTMHLERAHELAERAKRSNGAVQHEIDRAREIAIALYEEFHPRPERSPKER
jgi:hypothetical protein